MALLVRKLLMLKKCIIFLSCIGNDEFPKPTTVVRRYQQKNVLSSNVFRSFN